MIFSFARFNCFVCSVLSQDIDKTSHKQNDTKKEKKVICLISKSYNLLILCPNASVLTGKIGNLTKSELEIVKGREEKRRERERERERVGGGDWRDDKGERGRTNKQTDRKRRGGQQQSGDSL